MPTRVAASTTAPTPTRLAFIADLPCSSWCGLPPEVAYWIAPHMKAKTPTATETLRIVVARLVNSVLMLPSIGAETSWQLQLGYGCRLDAGVTEATRRPTTSASVSDGACHDRALQRAASVTSLPIRRETSCPNLIEAPGVG